MNTTVHKKLRVGHEIECIVMCVNDTCCRSLNFLKTLRLDENENKDNCELLHDAVVTGKKQNLLSIDVNYDYFIMNKPERVSIHKVI